MRTSFLLPIGIIVCTMSLAATIAAAEELSEHVLLLEEFAGGAGLPSGWELRGDGKVVVTAEAAHCGQYSLRVDDTSNADGAGANSKPVSVRPGVQYVATAWAKTKSGAVQFHLLFFDAAGKQVGGKSDGRNSAASWVLLRVADVAPGGPAGWSTSATPISAATT